jgi:hypothetical protein
MRAYIGSLAVFVISAVAATGSPAQMPPDDYIGRAFVDSEGCAFSRAEMNDAIVWVARLDASRAPICDEVPTFSGATERAFVTSPVSVSAAATSAPVVSKRAVPANAFSPKGFRPAWNDGRLNPNRGPRTSAGDAAMLRIWSNDVPMVRRGN